MITLRTLSALLSLIPAILLTGCEDADPLAPEAISFHGTTTGTVVGMAPAVAGRCPAGFPLLFTYQGAGTATGMGQITVNGSECVFFNPEDPTATASRDGEFIITAADGDQLFVAWDQTTISFEAPPSTWMLWSATAYATGGTGKYEDAELLDLTWKGGANIVTNETYSTLDGRIRYTK